MPLWKPFEDPAPKAERKPRHNVVPAHEWAWLPNEFDGTLQKHAFCADCGQVRPSRRGRVMDMGGIANLLGRFYRALSRQGRHVTEAERRLVTRRIEAFEADDDFALSQDHQMTLLSSLVAAQLGMTAPSVESYLRSC